ncbi:hypothetical protein KDX22_09110 [Burkholderia cenocepacia]|nr:hypothetical protein [Burkholderia cenocepacia]
MVTDERRKPVLQHPVESSGFNVMRDQVLRHIGEPEARKRRVEPPMKCRRSYFDAVRVNGPGILPAS